MWKINTRYMCNKHLLGEHCEMHMFVGAILKGKSIAGYIEKGLVEVDNIHNRHDKLEIEMTRRGMAHNSTLPSFMYMGKFGKVNIKKSMEDLFSRCPDCKKKFEKNK